MLVAVGTGVGCVVVEGTSWGMGLDLGCVLVVFAG